MNRALIIAASLALCSPSAAAQELGRLFLTPEQRASLDARRSARTPDKPAPVEVITSPTTRLDGYVKRSQGKSTVWVNGEPLLEGQQPDAPRVQIPGQGAGRVSVPLGVDGSHARLKPGETVNIGTGEVRDVIGEGRIHVRPRRNAAP
jgi:hypothetical protein